MSTSGKAQLDASKYYSVQKSMKAGPLKENQTLGNRGWPLKTGRNGTSWRVHSFHSLVCNFTEARHRYSFFASGNSVIIIDINLRARLFKASLA